MLHGISVSGFCLFLLFVASRSMFFGVQERPANANQKPVGISGSISVKARWHLFDQRLGMLWMGQQGLATGFL